MVRSSLRRRASAKQARPALAQPTQRTHTARYVLALWPDCADAYVLLPQATASNLEQARKLRERGVAAG